MLNKTSRSTSEKRTPNPFSNQIITYPESYPLACFTYYLLLRNTGERNAPFPIFQNIQYKYSRSHAIKLYAKIAHYYCMRVVILHANEHQLADRPVVRTYSAATATKGMLLPPGVPGTTEFSTHTAGGGPALLPTLPLPVAVQALNGS